MAPRSVRRALLPGLLAVLLAWSQAPAADRLVSTIGNDAANDCSVSPCLTIGHALTQAGSGDIVKVAYGRYAENLVVDASTVVTISGGWLPNFTAQHATRDTIIMGGDTAPVVDVSAGSGEVVAVTLDRLTIRKGGGISVQAQSTDDGSLTITLVDTIQKAARGFYVQGLTANATGTSVLDLNLTRSSFSRNAQHAIQMTSLDGSAITATMDDCTFKSNGKKASLYSAIDAVASGSSTLDLSVAGSLFRSNGSGIAVYAGGTAALTLAIADSILKTNGRGPIYGSAISSYSPLDGSVDIALTNVFINRQRGIGIRASAVDTSALSVTAVNSTIAKASLGGIEIIAGSSDPTSLTLTNCTITDTVAYYGGGLWIDGSQVATVSLKNTILWDNTSTIHGGEADVVLDGPNVTVDADHSDIGAVVTLAGTFNDQGGNIDADPKLRPTKVGYHLLAGSPAIDVGTCTGAPAQDFEFDLRPTGSGCDIGADEFVAP